MTIIGDAVGRALADALAARPDLDVAAVRVVLNSGATVSPAVKDDLMARMPGAFVYDTFGSSESGTFAKSTSGAGATPAQGRSPSPGAVVLDDEAGGRWLPARARWAGWPGAARSPSATTTTPRRRLPPSR